MPNEEMKVLVIEDEESFITALKVGLTREGFTVEVQSDGAEALNTFKTFNPDIVLLDLMLPNRSGVDICRDIREIAKTPIIMVTARLTPWLTLLILSNIGRVAAESLPLAIGMSTNCQPLPSALSVMRRAGNSATLRSVYAFTVWPTAFVLVLKFTRLSALCLVALSLSSAPLLQ